MTWYSRLTPGTYNPAYLTVVRVYYKGCYSYREFPHPIAATSYCIYLRLYRGTIAVACLGG